MEAATGVEPRCLHPELKPVAEAAAGVEARGRLGQEPATEAASGVEPRRQVHQRPWLAIRLTYRGSSGHKHAGPGTSLA